MRYIASASWTLDLRQQLIDAIPVEIVEEIRGQAKAYVPHYLPGANPWLHEFADTMGLPFEATRRQGHDMSGLPAHAESPDGQAAEGSQA